jgi:spoIIIJ-associated protein
LEFFTNLGIEIESFSVKEEDGKNIYRAILQTPDSKVLIGIHGKTLEALAHILGRMAEKKFEKKILIHLEVNDYLQAKEERLHQYIEKKISESQEKNEHTPLPSLTSYERKLVHAYIQEKNIPGLIAQST